MGGGGLGGLTWIWTSPQTVWLSSLWAPSPSSPLPSLVGLCFGCPTFWLVSSPLTDTNKQWKTHQWLFQGWLWIISTTSVFPLRHSQCWFIYYYYYLSKQKNWEQILICNANKAAGSRVNTDESALLKHFYYQFFQIYPLALHILLVNFVNWVLFFYVAFECLKFLFKKK